MRDFNFNGYGFLPFGKSDKGERELSLKDQLIERLERRFKEHQASLRVITVGSLAMVLSRKCRMPSPSYQPCAPLP